MNASKHLPRLIFMSTGVIFKKFGKVTLCSLKITKEVPRKSTSEQCLRMQWLDGQYFGR